jgi:hypothetical protein
MYGTCASLRSDSAVDPELDQSGGSGTRGERDAQRDSKWFNNQRCRKLEKRTGYGRQKIFIPQTRRLPIQTHNSKQPQRIDN